MMLDHLGETAAHDEIIAAISRTLVTPAGRTRDLGGTLSTTEAGRAVASELG
jgi:tartrate dehydrogenase/decarboxylase/D-malate dehydrogenase